MRTCSAPRAAAGRASTSRTRAPVLAAAEKPAPPAEGKRTPTRKRMMTELLNRSAEAMLARQPATAKSAAAVRAAPPPPPAPVDGDEVLDLSEFVAAPSPRKARKAASKARGGVAAPAADPEDEILDLDALGDAADDAEGLNTWTYDSEVGEVVFRRVAAPPKPGRDDGGAAELMAQLASLPDYASGRVGAAEEEEEEDGDEDEEDDSAWDSRAAERELDEPLRVLTALQRVDVSDEDDVIEALSGMSRLSLDKESVAILEEELGRKLKERERKQKRSADTDPTPPGRKGRRTHRQLSIIAGSAQNYKLWSPNDLNTRPMMAAVRAAVFSMLTALTHGDGQTGGLFPPGMRWLDLFAGTGAVGIEALSRGVADAHFVELDPWVLSNCLRKNLDHTRLSAASTVHNCTVESYLTEIATSAAGAAAGASLAPLRLAGGSAFDFVSVCPPYEKVSYPQLLTLIESSPCVKPGTLVLFEYPKYEKALFAGDRIGRLTKVRDRVYGRTFLAVYEVSSGEIGEGVAEGLALLSEQRAARALERKRKMAAAAAAAAGGEEEEEEEEEEE